MSKLIGIFAVVMIAFFSILIIQNHQRRRKNIKLQIKLKPIVDEAFDYAIHNAHSLMNENLKLSKQSNFVSEVWGKGVTAFEYLLDTPQIEKKDLRSIYIELTEGLTSYAQKNHLSGYDGHQVFVISDIWISNGKLHIDIAYISNMETWTYINDVAKSDQTK